MKCGPIISLLFAGALATPALAQITDAERRIADNLRGIEQYQVDQRVLELETRLDNLDLQRRSEANQRAIQEQALRQPVIPNVVIIPPAPAPTPQDLAETEARRQAALAANEARLRVLADQINN